jgi:hypothetical protein
MNFSGDRTLSEATPRRVVLRSRDRRFEDLPLSYRVVNLETKGRRSMAHAMRNARLCVPRRRRRLFSFLSATDGEIPADAFLPFSSAQP